MKTSGESHGNLTRAIKGTLGLKWLLRKSHTLASLPMGTAAGGVRLPAASCAWVQLAKGEPAAAASSPGTVGALRSSMVPKAADTVEHAGQACAKHHLTQWNGCAIPVPTPRGPEEDNRGTTAV